MKGIVLAKVDGATLRFLACSGKFDRCQLGHASNLGVDQKLLASIKEVLRGGVVALQPSPSTHQQSGVAELVSVCLQVFSQPDALESVQKVQAKLLCVAKFDPVVAHVIRKLGFTAVKKFPDSFDTPEACRLAFLHLKESFIPDFLVSLRNGNARNLSEGTQAAWKVCLAEEISEFDVVPLYQQVLAENDVLEAFALVSKAKQEVEELKKNGSKTSVQTGRAPSKMSTFKRKLSEMSSDGVGVASEALDLIEKPEGDADPEGGRKKRKSRRKPEHLLKTRYKRTGGDEVRLNRKREMELWPRKVCVVCIICIVMVSCYMVHRWRNRAPVQFR